MVETGTGIAARQGPRAPRSREQGRGLGARARGLAPTYAKVRGRLEQPNALGYSLSGEVLEACDGAPAAPGELVACAGAGFASHAEVVAVPRNLCARVPEEVGGGRRVRHRRGDRAPRRAAVPSRSSATSLRWSVSASSGSWRSSCCAPPAAWRSASTRTTGASRWPARAGFFATTDPAELESECQAAHRAARCRRGAGRGREQAQRAAGNRRRGRARARGDLRRRRRPDRAARRAALREGAPAGRFALVRARALRPRLRATRARLSGRLRALDGGPQPRGGAPADGERAAASVAADDPHLRPRRGPAAPTRCSTARSRRSASCSRYPGARATGRRGPFGSHRRRRRSRHRDGRAHASASSAPARSPARCSCPRCAGTRTSSPSPTATGAVGARVRASASAQRSRRRTPPRCSSRPTSTRRHRHPPRHPRRVRGGGAARRQARLRREAARPRRRRA